MRDALLDGWNDTDNPHAHDLARPDGEALPPLPEHGPAADGSDSLADPTSLFLARLLIPTVEAPAAVPAGTRPTPDFTALDAAHIDNGSRRFAYPADALAAVFGI